MINVVCPGWVRTDMGGGNAIRSVKEGAKGIVDVALMGKGSPSGILFRDGKLFDWQEPTDGAKPINNKC